MPGLLNPDAICPLCYESLCAIVDISNHVGVTREYFHEKGSPKARRKRRCKFHFTDHELAQKERRFLEVPTSGEKSQ